MQFESDNSEGLLRANPYTLQHCNAISITLSYLDLVSYYPPWCPYIFWVHYLRVTHTSPFHCFMYCLYSYILWHPLFIASWIAYTVTDFVIIYFVAHKVTYFGILFPSPQSYKMWKALFCPIELQTLSTLLFALNSYRLWKSPILFCL